MDMTEQPVDTAADAENSAPPPDGQAGQDDTARIEELQQQLEAARAQHARAVADYQNLERRSREERTEVGRLALAGVVLNFLPVLDDLERAVEAAEQVAEGASWAEGVRLVAQKFRQVLEQHGVREVDALGQPFDPAWHESVGAVPGAEGEVVDVLRRGYAIHDRVVRPAMVMIGNGEDSPAGAAEAGAQP
jgi:molecular chaperone GrpE